MEIGIWNSEERLVLETKFVIDKYANGILSQCD
jgi:hypothetical protein